MLQIMMLMAMEFRTVNIVGWRAGLVMLKTLKNVANAGK